MKRVLFLLLSGIVLGGLVLSSGIVPGASARSSGSSGWFGWRMMGTSSSHSMMGSWQQRSSTSRALTIGQAEHQVQRYITQYHNSHLVIDEIIEFQRNFYAIVKDTSTGHGAFEVLVNKGTGVVFPEYGPAMMWNTQYGMMAGGMGGMMGYGAPSGPMTVSVAQATRIARQWLSRNRPSTRAEAADQFPGYYTVHFRKNGVIAGMLSVNGYTAQVWYHTWHGTFIRMKTVND